MIVRRKLVPLQGKSFIIMNMKAISPNLDYDSFCFWVNYLVYSKKGERYDVTGWYEMGEVENDDALSIGRQTLMFFIPDTDTEYDNVYVVDRFNHCYKQEFSGAAMLKELDAKLKNYETIPQ